MRILPRLLDQSMKEKNRINAISLGLNLSSDTLSTAQMQVRDKDCDVNIGDWVELFTPTESAGIFRVVSIEKDYKSNICDISLEHGLGTLADRVILGKLDAHGVNGKDKASVTAIINKLLSFQSLWQLDECQFDEQFSFSFENANVFDCIRDVGKAVGNYLFAFDQSSLPWKLSLLDKPVNESASCEMRMDRNIDTMRVTFDRTDMATRIYPYGKNGITIEQVNNNKKYVEKNTAEWGIVQLIYTDSNITNKSQLKSTAQVMLEQRCQPIVTVAIDGYALAKSTGEPLDNIRIGLVCRIPIHYNDQSITMNQRVIAMSWQDVLNRPQSISVTLANRRETASRLAAETRASASRSSTAVQQNNGEIHALITGLDGSMTQLDVDLSGIRTRVENAEGNISTVTQTANAIETEVRDARGNFASLSLKIQDMVTSINLKADIITLEGYVQITDFEAQSARITNLMSGATTATFLKAQSGSFTTLNFDSAAGTLLSATTLSGGNVTAGTLTVGSTAYSAKSFTVDGTAYAFFLGTADINFNIAATQTYKDGVAAARASVTILSSDITSRGDETYYSSTKQIYVTVDAEASNGNSNNARIGVDASSAYNAGYNAGQAEGGVVSSDIQLDTFVWYDSSASQQISSYTTLSTLASIINSHKSSQGYATFRAVVKGATKYYKIAIG